MHTFDLYNENKNRTNDSTIRTSILLLLITNRDLGNCRKHKKGLHISKETLTILTKPKTKYHFI